MTTRSFWLFCSIVSCWSGALGCGEAPIGNLVASRQAALVGASSPIVFAVESSHRALFRRDGTVFYNKSGGAGGGRGFNVAAIDPQTGDLLEPVRNFDTWGSRNSGTAHRALITYLDGVADGTLLLFAVADEAGLTGWNASRCVRLGGIHVSDLLARLEALGSRRIADYCYQDRWAMAAIKGQGAPLIEQLGENSTATSIDLSFTPGQPPEPPQADAGVPDVAVPDTGPSPVLFSVESSHRALFRRDGTVFYNKSGGAGGGRGFNVAAIDPQTGNLLEPVRNFDTWGSRNSGTAHRALITYLDGVADGTLLLFAVADEAGLTGWNASRCVRLRRTHVFSLLAKLEALGSRRIADYCYRDRWAMAAIKGQGAPLIEQLGEDSTSTSIELSFTPGSGA